MKFDLKTFVALNAACMSGQTVTVQFTDAVERETEMQADEGMKADILRCYRETRPDYDEWVIVFDYTLHEAFNDRFAKSNYWGKDGKANLTAKESGWYKNREEWSFCDGCTIPYKIL